MATRSEEPLIQAIERSDQRTSSDDPPEAVLEDRPFREILEEGISGCNLRRSGARLDEMS